MKAVLLTLFGFLLAFPAWAGTFAIDLNDDSTQLQYIQNLNTQNYGDTLAKARYLYNDDSDTSLIGVAGGVTGSPGNVDGLKFGFDVALNLADTDPDETLVAVGIGVGVAYNPPALRGLGIDGHFVYSPEIFTFADGEDYVEWGAGVSYQVLPNARLTLAYQNIEAEIENLGDRELDDSVRIGIKLDF